jgi:ArsR family transcriptional regulator
VPPPPFANGPAAPSPRRAAGLLPGPGSPGRAAPATTALSLPEAAQLFRLLGEPTRLRLLLLLADRGEASVGDLAAAAGRSQPAASLHLGLLRRAGVVTSRREWKRVYFRLSSPFAAALLRRVRRG